MKKTDSTLQVQNYTDRQLLRNNFFGVGVCKMRISVIILATDFTSNNILPDRYAELRLT